MKEKKSKFDVVIQYNTFYFRDESSDEEWEKYISSLFQSMLLLKNDVEQKGLSEEVLLKHIQTENGLDILLALLGFSQENFMRVITFLRVVNDVKLNELVNRKSWKHLEKDKVEIRFEKLKNELQKNKEFAIGIVNLLIKGATIPILRNALPLFEIKKLDISKLTFNVEALLDTIVRYKVKGQYSASSIRNPERLIREILEKDKIKFESGKMKNVRRNLDFIIPSKSHPKVIIECSYEVTTSSGMGDKAKTEIEVSKDIKKNYPSVHFVGFVDGIGWYVRRNDLKKMVSAFDRVFTFHREQITEFRKFINGV